MVETAASPRVAGWLARMGERPAVRAASAMPNRAADAHVDAYGVRPDVAASLRRA
jgi:hypothetical protein